MILLKKYRYLVLRRMVQLSLLFLFLGGNLFGWKVLQGNYSAARIMGAVNLADPYATLQILATGFVAGADLLTGALSVLVLYGFFFGRMFCSWVCPMNLVTDAAMAGARFLGLRAKVTFSRSARYVVLVLGLLLSAILSVPAFEAISPVSMLHRSIIFSAGASWAVIAALFLFDLAVIKNGWCGHLCPIGAFYALSSRFAILRIWHREEKCTDCGDCFRVCPEVQVLSIINKKTDFIHSGECTNCMRCVEACQYQALAPGARNPLSAEIRKRPKK